ncbi:MAG: tetraacyldisaccharide 4'-kinase [Acidobacteriota bacterium]
MSFLLPPLALPYRAVTRARRALYRMGLFRGRSLPRPVVSVGNRSFGGSGKTPTVIALAEALLEQQLRVAILTRGYGRKGKGSAIVEGSDAEAFGDEPVLMAKRLQDADIVVGADRYESAMFYLREHDCDIFILDDGFQHLQLNRDLDIVIEDSAAALLREGRSALVDADVILLRDGARSASGRPTFKVSLEPAGVRLGGTLLPIGTLKEKRVLAFAGLARNGRFFDLLRHAGAIVVDCMSFDDHHRYSADDMNRIRRAAKEKGAALIVTTEKDGVKIQDESMGIVEVVMHIERLPELVSLIVSLIAVNGGEGGASDDKRS